MDPAEGAMGSGWGWVTGRVTALVVLVLAVGLAGLTFATSPGQPEPSPTDGLPAGADSTRVVELAGRFPDGDVERAVVVYERPDAPLTDADQETIRAARDRLGRWAVDGQVAPAVTADDGRAALLVVPLAPGPAEPVAELRDALRPAPDGLTVLVTGGAAFGEDIAAAFAGADITLLLATVVVVAVLLLVTYRSPLLWLVPLAVIGVADQIVAQALPWLARVIGERTDASISGIVSVLVFGAGTDYALLLISRYREELRRTESRRTAMTQALRGAGPAILASAGTVWLALLTLLVAVQTSNRTLGLAGAFGILVALVFGVIVLPAALVCLPRGVFWPFVPRVGDADPAERGFWARVARAVSRRPRAVLAAGVILLAGLSAGLVGTDVGLAPTEKFRTTVESVEGQQALARHFPAGAAQPVTVVTRAAAVGEVSAAAGRVDGVAAVRPGEVSTDGDLARVSVQLTSATGTPEADQAVRDLRAAVAGVPGAEALIGGAPAADLDQRDASRRDTLVIVPLVLAVVLLVLILLLRALVAPVLTLITVIVGYAASVGAATVVLRFLLDVPALDANVPLLSFLFLTALGVDYNIFLLTRAREETAARGSSSAGIVRALAATGGVITSAGILLAAVFAVLGVLPVIVLTQIGVIVGIGVLLDTLLVRTVVVPALVLLLGDRFWWPARPAAQANPGANPGPNPAG